MRVDWRADFSQSQLAAFCLPSGFLGTANALCQAVLGLGGSSVHPFRTTYGDCQTRLSAWQAAAPPAGCRTLVAILKLDVPVVGTSVRLSKIHIPDMSLPSASGGLAGGFFATSIGGLHPLGLEGWRFAFHVVAGISIGAGLVVLAIARDPRCKVCRSGSGRL